jgi:phosphate transport system substrate-binding protein
MSARSSLAIAVALLALGPAGQGWPVSAAEVAIIVHPDNPVNELSPAETARIFLQEQRYWPNGQRIYLVLQEAGAEEKQVMLKRVYQMDDAQLKKFWLGKLFRGEIAEFPHTLASNEAVKRFVSQAPNAIGFVGVSALDDSVKALWVDGKPPGDPDYPLKHSSN